LRGSRCGRAAGRRGGLRGETSLYKFLLVAAVVYLARKRRVARLQPHRQSSVPTIGGEVEA
jgi:hypothetical protein